jgi:hypothetical protein
MQSYKTYTAYIVIIIIIISTLDSLLVLHSTLVRSKLEYAPVDWNSFTSTDSSKLERIKRKFAALCYTRFLMAYVTIIMKIFT